MELPLKGGNMPRRAAAATAAVLERLVRPAESAKDGLGLKDAVMGDVEDEETAEDNIDIGSCDNGGPRKGLCALTVALLASGALPLPSPRTLTGHRDVLDRAFPFVALLCTVVAALCSPDLSRGELV